jgi:hypothetical protein
MTERTDYDAYLRLYGIEHHDLATPVNDGPRVPRSATAPRPPTVEADRPLVSVATPTVSLDGLTLTVTFPEDLYAVLAERIDPPELHDVCEALASRLCLDLYRIAKAVADVERDYELARQRALRSR